ncbi:MAG: PaaI family thioesterase [Deltaproteobacteria bacterium]|nr:PaaI family thioesterase [Deltaproteobacteria bacterium]
MNMKDDYIKINRDDRMAQHLGIRVVEASKGYAKATVDLAPNVLNGVGLAHGGLIYTLADIAFAAASNTLPDSVVLNAQTCISYLRPGKVGPLTAEARAVREGRLLVTFHVDVHDSEGSLLATATITGCRTVVER